MELKHIFQNWILTIIIGSALLPIIVGFYQSLIDVSNSVFVNELGLIPIAAFAGLIFSIPSLAVMLIANYLIQLSKLKSTCAIGADWIFNSLLILVTFIVLFNYELNSIHNIMQYALPYLIANSAYYAYQRFKPYRKPQILNLPS